MSEMIFLSHELCSETPGFAGNQDFIREVTKCIDHGSSCNQVRLNLSNHVGTHIDFPYHFDGRGKTLSDYQPKDFLFSSPQLLELEFPPGHLITPGDLEEKIKNDTDLLLLKTGFEDCRGHEKYWKENPGFHRDCGIWLRENFPNLRGIGFDFISLTSYQHRDEGREAHRTFLGSSHPGTPLWIIEDMKLSSLSTDPVQVLLAPLLLKEGDGAQATIFAYL